MKTDAPKPHLLLVDEYPSWNFEELTKSYTLHRYWDIRDKETFLSRHGPLIQAMATSGDSSLSRSLIDRLSALKIVACYGVGVDALDLAVCKSRSIVVTTTPDLLTGDVADLATGLVLAVCRRIPAGDTHVREGHWTASSMPLVNRVHSKKLGICGYGRIGRTVAQRFSGFDMEIGYHDIISVADVPYKSFPSIKELAEWCDILVVTVSGGAGSHLAINAEVLEALGPNGFLVNVSRGTAIDETALLAALRGKIIRGAGLDVFANAPRINSEFLTLPNAVLQPHHASGTLESRQEIATLVSKNIEAFFTGNPLISPLKF